MGSFQNQIEGAEEAAITMITNLNKITIKYMYLGVRIIRKI